MQEEEGGASSSSLPASWAAGVYNRVCSRARKRGMCLRAKQAQCFSFYLGGRGSSFCIRGAGCLGVCTRLEAVCPMWLCDNKSFTCGRAGKSGVWALPRRLQFPLVCAPHAPLLPPPLLPACSSLCLSALLCVSLCLLSVFALARGAAGGT